MNTLGPREPREASLSAGRPTMRDVALLAQVSLKTVSRVINGETTVDPELASRVRRAAAQLNYQPNLTASNLRRSDGRSATIGLLVQDVSNPFSASIYRAAEEVASRRGVMVLAGSIEEDAALEKALIANFVARRVDGLILVPAGHDHSYLQFDQRAGMAFVFVDRAPELLAADSVVSDNREGTAGGVAHLIARGHRRIGYCGDLLKITTAMLRFEGYRDALKAAGIALDPALVRHDLHTRAAAEAAVLDILRSSDPPSALFTAQNRVTVAAIRALRRLGLEHAVALVGFDDFELADLLEPGVTVVAQDPTSIGRLGAEILFARIDRSDAAVEQRVVPTRLIERGSGEIPPREQRLP
jgi:LacI family transcriptional regulator